MKMFFREVPLTIVIEVGGANVNLEQLPLVLLIGHAVDLQLITL